MNWQVTEMKWKLSIFAFLLGSLSCQLFFFLSNKLFGCKFYFGYEWWFIVIFGSMFFPLLRARQYLKNQTIETGFALGWISVRADAGEKKRKLALFFDTIFYLICTVVIVVAYFFSDKRCQIF